MKNIAFPKAQYILDHESFFGVRAPENRISIIKHISKRSILFEMSALNYRLAPKVKMKTDTSLKRQLEELKYFTQVDQDLYEFYYTTFQKYCKDESDYPLIFNRQACLFAMEEIVNSEEMLDIDNFVMDRTEVWGNIMKYLLTVNQAITMPSELEEVEDSVVFEALNSKLIAFNELFLGNNQLMIPYRGYKLISYMQNHLDFHCEVDHFFTTKYGISYKTFILNILNIFIANNQGNAEFEFYYSINKKDQGFFDSLSNVHPNKEPIKLLSVKKYPLIKTDDFQYIMTDNIFLLEKTYTQFINDFWFDWVKLIKTNNGKSKFNINHYRGVFGYFFEEYVSGIFKRSFGSIKYSKLLLFEQLKCTRSKLSIEIADVYFRVNKKIILGQVKSGSIYDTEKYSGDLNSLYKNDRNNFFATFGVEQIVESIRYLDEYIPSLDSKFPKGHTYEIYPCIIVNDKVFQTPLIAELFNNRFQELLTEKNVLIPKVRIKPLSLIHISDLELLEKPLIKKPTVIWDIFKYHFRDKRFIPPFYDSLYKKINLADIPDQVMELYKELFSTNT